MAIVGAGAAGLATAIFTRRDQPTLSVLVLEGAKKPGAKILVSGGARCNVTNVRVARATSGAAAARSSAACCARFPVRATIDFFQEIGVPLHEEADGKLFPDSNRARDVLDRLLAEAAHVGVVLQNDTRVRRPRAHAGGVSAVHLPRFHRWRARSCSRPAARSLPKSGSDGQGYEFAQALGHTIVPTTPALVPLVLERSGVTAGAPDLARLAPMPSLRPCLDLPDLPALPALSSERHLRTTPS